MTSSTGMMYTNILRFIYGLQYLRNAINLYDYIIITISATNKYLQKKRTFIIKTIIKMYFDFMKIMKLLQLFKCNLCNIMYSSSCVHQSKTIEPNIMFQNEMPEVVYFDNCFPALRVILNLYFLF